MARVFLKVFFGRAPFENQNNVEEFKNSQIAEIFFSLLMATEVAPQGNVVPKTQSTQRTTLEALILSGFIVNIKMC